MQQVGSVEGGKADECAVASGGHEAGKVRQRAATRVAIHHVEHSGSAKGCGAGCIVMHNGRARAQGGAPQV